MNKKFKNLIKATILGASSSILSVNALDNKNLEVSIDDFNSDFDDEFFSNEEVQNPLKYSHQPKLLLFQNKRGDWEYSSHRSHRSHSSHRSHYSSSTGSGRTNSSRFYNSGSSNATKKITINYHKIKFKNNCPETVNLLVRYKDDDSGKWVNKAWYRIAPFETAYILNTRNSNIYFYATSNSYTWGGNDNTTNFGGKVFNLSKIAVTSYGDFVHNLNCN